MANRRQVVNPYAMYGVGGMHPMGYAPAGNYMHRAPAPPVPRTQQRRAPQGHNQAPGHSRGPSQGHHHAPARAPSDHPSQARSQGHHPGQQHHHQQQGHRQISNRGVAHVHHHPSQGRVAPQHGGGRTNTVTRNNYIDNHQNQNYNPQSHYQQQASVPSGGGNVFRSRDSPAGGDDDGSGSGSEDDFPEQYQNNTNYSRSQNYNSYDNTAVLGVKQQALVPRMKAPGLEARTGTMAPTTRKRNLKILRATVEALPSKSLCTWKICVFVCS